MQSVGLPVSYHKILRSGLVGTFCGIALVTGLSTSSTTVRAQILRTSKECTVIQRAADCVSQDVDGSQSERARPVIESLSHSAGQPAIKTISLCITPSFALPFLSPPLHPLRSLCSPYRSFRRLTSHPLLPHLPPQCVLCIVNFGIAGVDDQRCSPLPSSRSVPAALWFPPPPAKQ